jgi:hypothetical protein
MKENLPLHRSQPDPAGKKAIRFRISGENGVICKYAQPAQIDSQEARLKHELAQTFTKRYLKPKKAKTSSSYILSSFQLIADNGLPRYIGVLNLSKRGTTYIRVVVGQGAAEKLTCLKFNVTKFPSTHDAYLAACSALSDLLGLNQNQSDTLSQAWDAFNVANFSA